MNKFAYYTHSKEFVSTLKKANEKIDYNLAAAKLILARTDECLLRARILIKMPGKIDTEHLTLLLDSAELINHVLVQVKNEIQSNAPLNRGQPKLIHLKALLREAKKRAKRIEDLGLISVVVHSNLEKVSANLQKRLTIK